MCTQWSSLRGISSQGCLKLSCLQTKPIDVRTESKSAKHILSHTLHCDYLNYSFQIIQFKASLHMTLWWHEVIQNLPKLLSSFLTLTATHHNTLVRTACFHTSAAVWFQTYEYLTTEIYTADCIRGYEVVTNVKLVEQKYTHSFTTDFLFFFFQKTFEKTYKKGNNNLVAESVKKKEKKRTPILSMNLYPWHAHKVPASELFSKQPQLLWKSAAAVIGYKINAIATCLWKLSANWFYIYIYIFIFLDTQMALSLHKQLK